MSVEIQVDSLSDNQLKMGLEVMVRSERKLTAQIVEHIAEVERRKLHLAWGYSSLFDYLVTGLGYSESAAYRRMQAARAVRTLPEIKQALVSGDLKLSQVSQAQTALRQEERASGKRVSQAAKRDLFDALKNKTALETKKILSANDGTGAQGEGRFAFARKQYIEEKNYINMNLPSEGPEELYKDLQRIKEIYSNIHPVENGGGHQSENLRVMCRAHNIYRHETKPI